LKTDKVGGLARRIPGFPALLAVAAIYAGSLAFLPAGGFWINDNASKFLQMRSIVDGRYRDYAITLPGRAIDPDLDFNPLIPPYFAVRGKEVYSQYSLVFALLSSIPYQALGHRGLYLLPLLSSLLMLAGCARIAVLLGADRRAAGVVVALAALATPTWFYSLTYWEHTPAACLLIWGLRHLLGALPGGDRRRMFLGGLLLALAVAFRDELYLFLPVAVGAVLLRTRAGARASAAATAAAGSLAVLLPLWLLQWQALGAPLGFHLQGTLPARTELVRQIVVRPEVFYDLFLAVGAGKAVSIVLIAPFLAAASLGLRRGIRTPWISAAAVLASLCGLVFLAGFRGAAGIMPWLMASNSVWPAAPALILAFLAPANGEGQPGRRTVLEIALLYAAVYWLCTPDWRVSGLHWGNRLLFILYPLLAVPAGMNLAAAWRGPETGRAVRRSALAAVTAVSIGAQLYSLWLLQGRLEFSGRINEAVSRACAEGAGAVVTDLWWIPQELYTVNGRYPVFLFGAPRRLPSLRERLCGAGYRDYLMVTSPRGGGPSRPGVARVEDDRFGFFTVELVREQTCRE
jgi:hypothetical protein